MPASPPAGIHGCGQADTASRWQASGTPWLRVTSPGSESGGESSRVQEPDSQRSMSMREGRGTAPLLFTGSHVVTLAIRLSDFQTFNPSTTAPTAQQNLADLHFNSSQPTYTSRRHNRHTSPTTRKLSKELYRLLTAGGVAPDRLKYIHRLAVASHSCRDPTYSTCSHD